MKPLAIGIDIGGTHTRIGGVTVQGDIMVENQITTHAYPDGSAYLQALHAQVRQMINKTKGFFDIMGVGIGAPGMRLSTGSIDGAANLPWEKALPIRDYFEECLTLPVQVTNDANLTAIGELLYGVGRNMNNFITITLGTGLGGGVIVNGELLNGDEGQAGEFGHMTYKRGGRHCGCGRRGCLETYVSAPGLQRTVMELLSEYPNPA
ncbi:MAG TPA: glucokinase, partial [Cytophagales bacterium]|nr:glucokinase [Cytophagales bacterium]